MTAESSDFQPHAGYEKNPLAYCSADERSDEATAYLAEGELALLKGDIQGLSLFEKASELDPCNPELFIGKG